MRHRAAALGLALVCVGVVAPLHGQAAAGGAGLRGTVSGPDGRPLAGAFVIRFATRDTVRSDSLGRYTIARLAQGRHIFVVGRPGYQSVEMEVTFTSDTTITVDLPLEPARMVSAAKLERVGFTERRNQATAGRYEGATLLGPEEIAAKAATRTSQLFESIPNVTMRMEQTILTAFGHDGRCIMSVWVEGRRMNNVFPPQQSTGRAAFMAGGSAPRSSYTAPVARTTPYTGLDELIQVGDIAAIEIYPRWSRMPSQFQSATQQQVGLQYETRTADCGAIVIWTTQEQ